MKSEKVSFKIQLCEELLKDIKKDFRSGHVAAAARKSENLQGIALGLAEEIVAVGKQTLLR